MSTANRAFLFLAAVFLAGCSSAPKVPVTPATPVSAAPAPAAPSKPAPSRGTAAAPIPAHLDPKSLISMGRSVYFDFDDATVKRDDFALIERQGKYLASNPKLRITIEGNTDERGSAEYNLALGQKRAQAVLRAMKVYGASESQMEATSWGSEKPRASGHDESDWSQNRRADIVYPTR